MPDSAEHRVDMHNLVQERRREGKPVWVHKINMANIFNNEDLTFEQRRDAIVQKLRNSTWIKKRLAEDELDSIDAYLNELADTTDGDDFDSVMSYIYDEADWDRVWLGAF